MKYQYNGNSEAHVIGAGIVKPGEVIEVEFEINNPDFVEVKDQPVKKSKHNKETK
jgi:hypothetical protein